MTIRQWKEWLTSDQDSRDKPLFLVVTIKPRLDRLDEAEAQLQSMRQNTLKEPGCVFMHLVQPQDDPDTWVKSWTGEEAWPATNDLLFEYACHEANYALGDILRGARLREADLAKKSRK